MKRALSLYFPMWSIDLVRRRTPVMRGTPRERATLLVSARAGRQIVERCCEVAARAGVVAGVSLSHARSLLACEAQARDFTPEKDERALVALASWASKYSPSVGVDPPDGLLIDITGCQRLFRGEARLVKRLARDLSRLGFASRIAVAPTSGGAWAVARFGVDPITLVEPAELRATLDPLPIRALRILPEVEASLRAVGVERIAELMNLPRESLGDRYGGDLLRRIDQAFGGGIGRRDELLVPVRPRSPIAVERDFDGPVKQLEAIELAVRGLLVELSKRLLSCGRGVLAIRIEMKRSDLPPEKLRIVCGLPSRDARHLWTLVRPRLERVNMGFGVESITITALRTGVIHHEQARAWEDVSGDRCDADDRAFAGLVDQLVNRLGGERVMRLTPVASHIPERAFTHTPRTAGGIDTKRTDEVAPHRVERPSVLLDPPAPIHVIALTPDGPIARLRLHGEEFVVVECLGPVRVGLEWWMHDAPPRAVCRGRDYFRARIETGRWLWLYREVESAAWFLHGYWA